MLLGLLYLFLVGLSTLFTVMLAVYAWSQRQTPGVKEFAGLMLAISSIGVYFILVTITAAPELAFVWVRLRFVGLAFTPVFFFIFVLRYVHRDQRLTWLSTLALCVIPTATQIIVWVLPEQFFGSWELVRYENFSMELIRFTGWFNVHFVYSVSMMILGCVLLVIYAARIDSSKRGAVALIVVSAVIAIIFTSAPFGIGPTPGFRLTPLGVGIFGLGMGWALLQLRFLGMPIAYDQVFHSMKDAVLVLDNQSLILQVNPAAETLFGHKCAEIVNQPIRALIPKFRQQFPDEKQNANRAIQIELGQTPHIFDSQWLPIQRRGQRLGSLLVLRDMTDEEAIEQRLRESEQRFKNVYEHAPIGLALMSLEGKWTHVNPFLTEMLGYSYEELLTKDFQSLTHPDDLSSNLELFEQALRGEISRYQMEKRYLHKDGSAVWGLLSVSLVRDSEQCPQYFIAQIVDITAKKAAESKLRQENEFLGVLHQMTLDLLQRRNTADLLHTVVQTASVFMDAPYCEFSLKEGDELAVYAFTDNQPFLKGDRVGRGDAPLAWQAHDTGKPAIVDDYSEWADHRPLYDHLMLRAAADLPLMVGENCVGMLSMAREIKGYPFSPDDVQKGMVIAQLAAVILENTRLHETALREIQERKQTEEALRESNRRYDDLVQNIPVMVYRTRLTPQGEYGFDYVSPRVRQISGHEPQDVLQNPGLLFAQIHPEEFDELQRLQDESAKNLITFLWEGRFLINGQVRWMHLESHPVKQDDGSIVWDGIQLDLTAQREAEIALRNSQRFIERVTSTVPDLIYVYDMIEQRAIYRNRDLTAALGYSPEEAEPIKADPRILLHPEDREREAENAKRYQLAKDGDVIGTEYRVRHKNGEWRWMYRRETIYERTADGLPRQILGIAQDVTDRKNFELELREREHQYRALFEQSKDAVAIVDMTGAIKRANQQAAEMFGFTVDELVGMNPSHLVVAEEVSESADVIAALRSGEKVPTYERKFMRKDKSVFTAEVNAAFVYDSLGNPSHIQSIVHDISARKAAEEERMQLLAKLQIANRDLQDFAYIISHDLKAPLRGISSVMSWLTSDYSHLLDEDGRELIALLNGRVERMEQMINGVLEYSRVGRDAEKRVAVDLNRLVGEVKADVDPEERVEVIIETPLPTLVIEPTRIRQVFQNLLDNAVKFIDKPEGEIRVGCKQQDDCWVFWVQDNGSGIEQRHFERIFQIFQTLTPRDQMENTGIGLSIVKRIIELYEGKIWLESTIGKGSTFFFSLPKNYET